MEQYRVVLAFYNICDFCLLLYCRIWSQYRPLPTARFIASPSRPSLIGLGQYLRCYHQDPGDTSQALWLPPDAIQTELQRERRGACWHEPVGVRRTAQSTEGPRHYADEDLDRDTEYVARGK